MPQERRHSRERPVPDRWPRQPDDRCVVTHEPDVPLGVHPDLGEGGTIQSRHCRAIGREVDAQGEAQREPDQGAVGDDQHSCAKNDRRRVSDAARRGRAPSSSPPREASTAPRPFRRAIGMCNGQRPWPRRMHGLYARPVVPVRGGAPISLTSWPHRGVESRLRPGSG